MSTPRTLTLPDGVEATTIQTPRLTVAVHRAPVADPRGHVLLIPGWTGSKEDFTPLLPLLAAQGYDATSYDQRGQFESPGAAGDDYSLAGFGADAIAVAQTLGGRRVHVMGHSFGGLVAQTATIAEPTLWATLSLLCTGPASLGESAERPLQLLIDALDGGIDLGFIHDYRQQMTGATHPADISDFLARRFSANSRESLRAMTNHLMRAPDHLDQVIASGVPTWVGRGAKDDAWPHEAQAAMAARLGVQVHVVDEADHSPAIQNPQGLAAAWLPFLNEHPAG